MQTQCVRCQKTIDTVQGYKFSPNEYLCMSCYDEYKAERTAKAKKQHKNPLLDQFGAETPAPTSEETRPPITSKPQEAPSRPFQTKPPPTPSGPQPTTEPVVRPPPPDEQAQAPSPPQAAVSAEFCDVCKKPITDFKVPLKSGKKVCWDCNDVVREVAKSIILNVQCPHCGKEIQVTPG